MIGLEEAKQLRNYCNRYLLNPERGAMLSLEDCLNFAPVDGARKCFSYTVFALQFGDETLLVRCTFSNEGMHVQYGQLIKW